jgi:hypothetical protein
MNSLQRERDVGLRRRLVPSDAVCLDEWYRCAPGMARASR